jgi:hypothetical protein
MVMQPVVSQRLRFSFHHEHLVDGPVPGVTGIVKLIAYDKRKHG